MDFENILSEIIDKFIEGEKVNIEEYCKKYPEYKEELLAKFKAAKFLRENFREEDLSGKKLGEYILLQELGRGGMGIVYLAIHPALSRLTAIKILPHSFIYDKDVLRNFQEEAKIIAKFNHPNIVPIYSINETNSTYYIAMGYISGPSLKNIIEMFAKTKIDTKRRVSALREFLKEPSLEEKNISQKSISLKRGLQFWSKSYFQIVATLGSEIANALVYAHQNGIVHGDLKPSNILLTNEAIPMIVDFGLSKDLKKIASSASDEFTGTLTYAAPEQIRENIISEKTDIWSLGVTLYELLTFNNPFREDSIKKTVDKITKAYIPALKSYDKKIPWELEAIIFKCLEKDPKNRYESVEELTTDLNNYLESKPIKARKINITRRTYLKIKRYPRVTIILFVLFISSIVASNYIYLANLNKLIEKAANLRLKGEFDSAQKIYEKIMKLKFNIPLTKIIREKALLGMGDIKGIDHPEEALLYYEKCLQINPRNILALYGKKLVYDKIGKLEEAKKCLLHVLEIAPYDWMAVNDYASFLRKEGEIDLALDFLAEKLKNEMLIKYGVTIWELSMVVEDLFTKLHYNKEALDDYYKIKKILKLKGFSKDTIEKVLDKIRSLYVDSVFEGGAVVDAERLKKIAIEKNIIPEQINKDFTDMNAANKFKLWLASNKDSKIKIVDSLKEYFKKNGVIIKQPSIRYVVMIDAQVTPFIQNNLYKPGGSAESDNLIILWSFKNFAIILGDYDNGDNRLELLKQVIGEDGIEKMKKENPEKYEDFLNE